MYLSLLYFNIIFNTVSTPTLWGISKLLQLFYITLSYINVVPKRAATSTRLKRNRKPYLI
jgi:hypothetical protein